ncbi:unnamed protein product [Boreogadus saida]
MSPMITHIINQSLRSGRAPTPLRTPSIGPLPRKPSFDPAAPANYRRVSMNRTRASSKREAILVGPPRPTRSPTVTSTTFCGPDIHPSSSGPPLGVRADPHLTSEAPVKHLRKT